MAFPVYSVFGYLIDGLGYLNLHNVLESYF
jgi:hypothetical protein